MKIIGNPYVEQVDLSKPRSKCRKWKLRVKIKNGPKAQRKTKNFEGKYRDAQKALLAFQDKIENGEENSSMLFSDYSKKWLKYREDSNSFSSNTLSNNYYSLKHLNEIFKDDKLSELTTRNLKYGLTKIKAMNNPNQRLKNATVRKLHKTMKCVLNSAVSDGYIDENPMINVPLPKNDTKERIALTRDEYEYLLKILNKKNLTGHTVALLLICKLGLRRGEVVALSWSDYDENSNCITINNSYKEKGSKIGNPKSEAGRRTIPLNKSARQLLNKWKEEMTSIGLESDYICCNNTGGFLHPQNLYRTWKKLIKKNNNLADSQPNTYKKLPEIALHDLRHTNLSIAARHMSLFELQTYAGWSSLEPAKTYIHNDLKMLHKGLEDANL